MGLMPPGSAKTTYSSIIFPTHVMGRFPGTQIIAASYGSDLPRKWGRKSRAIVRSKQFQRIFDTSLSTESAAADEWALANGSEFMGGGILSGLTGNRASGIVWDDLIRGREQAESDTFRNKTWEGYYDDLLTRKKPGAWEVGVTTRWHHDDVAGRILPENYNGESGWIDCRDGNRWYVVCVPAEADRTDDILGREIGERIWPEWFPPDHFKPFKRNARTWNSLYQQKPTPDTGSYFLADWLRPYTKAMAPDRKTLEIYGGSDYATTEKGGDYTVHVIVGIDPDGNAWLLDCWREQTTSDKWVSAWCDLVLKWKPLGWAEETGQIRAGVGPFLDRESRKRKAYCARETFPTGIGSKPVRAQSFRGYAAQYGLYVPTDAEWWPECRRELLTFPAGVHDDFVDAMALVFQLLDRMTNGRPLPKDEPDEEEDAYTSREDDWSDGEGFDKAI